jgi:hypothetical protein
MAEGVVGDLDKLKMDEENGGAYKAPAQKSVSEILAADAEDEVGIYNI